MSKERLMKILLSPVVSEKSAMAADKANQFAFKVAPMQPSRRSRRLWSCLFDVKVRAGAHRQRQGQAKSVSAR